MRLPTSFTRTGFALALAGSLSACSSYNPLAVLTPYRIDVQQGNALDADQIAKLKPGLSRTQVRFLLGTPLVVDPFRENRWDYVYVMRQSGDLTEQKRVTLIFQDETLVKIEGEGADALTGGLFAEAALPPSTPEPAQPEADGQIALADVPPAAPDTGFDTPAESGTDAEIQPFSAEIDSPAGEPQPSAVTPMDDADPSASSIVAPLNPPAPTEPAEPQSLPDPVLITESDADTLQPAPGFDETQTAPGDSDADRVRAAVDAWVAAWASRDIEGYLAAYSRAFLPQGGGSRADWEKRRRLLIGSAQRIDVRVENPNVELTPDGAAIVSFEQYYRSDTYRDAVRKQLRMQNEGGQWMIEQERVLGILRQR